MFTYLNKKLKLVIKSFLKIFNLKIVKENSFFNLNLIKFKDYLDNADYFNGDLSEEKIIAFFSKNHKESKSQLLQDIFVDYMLNKDEGFFCEVGACDGIVHSNTLYLEKKRRWNGILCEPSELWEKKLIINRPNCILEFSPIFSSNKNVQFFFKNGGRSFIKIDRFKTTEGFENKILPSITLNALFKKNNIKKIDYISIDTEGTEYEILISLNLREIRPTILTIEHNYNNVKANKIFNYLKNNNYLRIFKSISRFDDWYVDNVYLQNLNKDFFKKTY